jgi:DnaJ-domain-containing protein 1
MRTDLLSCDLGTVVNISGYGMQVESDGPTDLRVGQKRGVAVRWSGYRIAVKCRVAWVTRTKSGRTAVGLAFDGISPRLRAALEHLARFGFVPEAGEVTGNGGEGAPPVRRSKKSPPDYYRLLGVPAGATAAEVRGAYYRLAQQHHPDASRAPDAPRMFQSLAEAYRTLRDPEARRQYDALRHAAAEVGVG